MIFAGDSGRQRRALWSDCARSVRRPGAAAAAGTVLDTRALSGVVAYEPTELVITALALVPLMFAWFIIISLP